MLEYGDFTRPFLRVASLLQSFDVTVANLEGNLSDTLPQPADFTGLLCLQSGDARGFRPGRDRRRHAC